MLKRVQHNGGGVKSVAYWGQAQIDGKINPLGIFGFNQIDLPTATPVFQLLLSGDRVGHVAKHLEADKAIHRIFRRISGRQLVAVLEQALDQVRRYAYVERAVRLAGEYVDARLLGFLHGPRIGSRWALKQVQGDDFGGIGRY